MNVPEIVALVALIALWIVAALWLGHLLGRYLRGS